MELDVLVHRNETVHKAKTQLAEYLDLSVSKSNKLSTLGSIFSHKNAPCSKTLDKIFRLWSWAGFNPTLIFKFLQGTDQSARNFLHLLDHNLSERTHFFHLILVFNLYPKQIEAEVKNLAYYFGVSYANDINISRYISTDVLSDKLGFNPLVNWEGLKTALDKYFIDERMLQIYTDRYFKNIPLADTSNLDQFLLRMKQDQALRNLFFAFLLCINDYSRTEVTAAIIHYLPITALQDLTSAEHLIKNKLKDEFKVYKKLYAIFEQEQKELEKYFELTLNQEIIKLLLDLWSSASNLVGFLKPDQMRLLADKNQFISFFMKELRYQRQLLKLLYL